MFDNSRGRSSSPDGLKVTEGTEMARLDRGADISDGGDPGVAREAWDSADRQGGVVMEESNLHKTQLTETLDNLVSTTNRGSVPHLK